MTYEAWILLHLTGVIVFFSNGVAALLWRGRAERIGEARLLAYAYRTLDVGDAWLTPASVAAIVAGGVGAARLAGLPLLRTDWIAWSIVAFSISGLVFVFRVAPLQRSLAESAEVGAATGEFNVDAHRRDASRWAFWAHLSLIAAGLTVPIMIMKPEWSR